MEHKHKTFHLELSELRTKVSAMGELVIEQLERALLCLKEHNVGDARTITERDINVNRMDIEVEEMCLQFLALHQPVAGDLRSITAAMKITTELERIGDRVVNICEAVTEGGAHDPVSTDTQVLQIGKLATAMVSDAMASFSRSDATLVKSVWKKRPGIRRPLQPCVSEPAHFVGKGTRANCPRREIGPVVERPE